MNKLFLYIGLLPVLSSCGLGLCAGSVACNGLLGPAVLSFTSGTSLDLGTRGFGMDHTELLTVTNQGGFVATNLAAQTLPADFTWTGGAFPGLSGTCTSSLGAGASCTLDIVYRPRPPLGSQTGTITLSYFDGSSAQQVALAVSSNRDNGSFTRARGANGNVYALSPQVDGSIFAGGAFTNFLRQTAMYLVKLNGDGSLASGFSLGTGFNGEVRTLLTVGDRLYVGGAFTTIDGTTVNRITRLTMSGVVDTSFNAGTAATNNTIYSIVQATDGSGDLYVAGDFTNWNGAGRNGMVRIDSNGALDNGFAIGTGFNGVVRTILPTPDGSAVYVGGNFTTYKGAPAVRIARILANGNLDATFDTSTGFNATVNTMAFKEDTDEIYVLGAFATFKGVACAYLCQLSSAAAITAAGGPSDAGQAVLPTTDGSQGVYIGTAQGFGAGELIKRDSAGAVTSILMPVSNAYSDISALAYAVDGTGDVLLAGRVNNFHGKGFDGVGRMSTTTHRMTEGFHAATGLWDANTFITVNTIEDAGDGSGDIYVGGIMDNYGGSQTSSLIRLTASGAYH